MHIVIPDEYQNVIRKLDCFKALREHQVSVFHDAEDDTMVLAERFADADTIVLTRERTKIDEALLSRLPKPY